MSYEEIARFRGKGEKRLTTDFTDYTDLEGVGDHSDAVFVTCLLTPTSVGSRPQMDTLGV